MREKLITSWRFLFTTLIVVLGTLFLFQQRKELHTIIHIFSRAHFLYLALAAFAALGVVVAQGYVYKFSFQALDRELPWHEAAILYLKRFFLSPFLPGGFSVAQYTLSTDLEPYKITVKENAIASSLFLISGSVSYFLIMIPALFVASRNHSIPTSMTIAGVGLLLIMAMGGIFALVTLPKNKDSFFTRRFPKLYTQIQEVRGMVVNPRRIIGVLLLCLSVDILGIATLWFSMRSLHIYTNLSIATLGYVITILVVTLSPLLQGIFLVEGALALVLAQLGIATDQAIAAALLYRAYQLWLPFFIGGAFMVVPSIRRWVYIYPAGVTVTMGVINIVSALSIPLERRIIYLEEYLPTELIAYSRTFTLISGFILLLLGIGLLRRSKNAWNAAVLLVCLSVFSHIIKGIDYEEALYGLVTLEILLMTRGNYTRSLRADLIR